MTDPVGDTDANLSMHASSPTWPGVVLAVLGAGTVVVPLVVAEWRVDPFVLPRLAVLWMLLVACALVITAGVVLTGETAVRFRPIHGVDLALAAFVVLNIAATVTSVDPGQSLVGERGQYQGLLTTLLYASFFVVARLCVTTVERALRLFTAASCGVVVVSLYAIAQEAGIDPVWGDQLQSDRAFASIGQPNALASYLVIGVPLSVVLVRRARGLWLLLALGAVGVEIIAVLLTESRGGYIGLLVSLLAIGVVPSLRPTEGPTPLRAVAAGLVALTVVLAALGPAGSLVAESWDRLATIQELDDDDSIRAHRDIWAVGVHIAAERPLLGTGPETFPDVFPAQSREVLPADRVAYFDAFRVESPHNLYVAIASGAGLVTLAVFAWFVVASGATMVRAASNHPSAAPALFAVVVAGAGFAVTNFFITADLTSSWLMWVLAGAALGVARAQGTADAQATP